MTIGAYTIIFVRCWKMFESESACWRTENLGTESKGRKFHNFSFSKRTSICSKSGNSKLNVLLTAWESSCFSQQAHMFSENFSQITSSVKHVFFKHPAALSHKEEPANEAVCTTNSSCNLSCQSQNFCCVKLGVCRVAIFPTLAARLLLRIILTVYYFGCLKALHTIKWFRRGKNSLIEFFFFFLYISCDVQWGCWFSFWPRLLKSARLYWFKAVVHMNHGLCQRLLLTASRRSWAVGVWAPVSAARLSHLAYCFCSILAPPSGQNVKVPHTRFLKTGRN